MNYKEFIEAIESTSRAYKDDRPSINTHQRIMLERRWQTLKLIMGGINDDNYKTALHEVGLLMDKAKKKDSPDGWLLNKLADEIEEYER